MEHSHTVQAGCLLMALVYHHGIAQSTSNYFGSKRGKKIKTEFIYSKVESSSVFQCASKCLKNSSCLAASFHDERGLCRLSGYRVYEKGRNSQRRLRGQAAWLTLSKIGCLVGWVDIGGTCYFFYDEPVDYNEAKDFCARKDGKLAEPLTFGSFELLRNYTATMGGACYLIGLNYIDEEDRFVWTSNGEVPDYTAWNGTARLNLSGADCVCLYDDFGYRWADAFCTQKTEAICEETWH